MKVLVKTSAGIMPYRVVESVLEVYLVHPGGPYGWNKDQGVWSIAKGEIEPDEDHFATALREFGEETGGILDAGEFISLGEVRQANGKRVLAWAVESPALDEGQVESNLFEMEWPRGSGHLRQFPEVDRAGWFSAEVAPTMIIRAQGELVIRLADELRRRNLIP